MGGKGPTPKEADKRQRRNSPREMTEIDVAARAADAPKKLPSLPDGKKYGPRTLEWFETWRTSPQASRFVATDWQVLFRIAILVDRFWDGELNLAGEIRLEEAKLGATPEDRLRLQWRITNPNVNERETPTATAQTRTRRARKDPRRGLKIVAGGAAGGR